VGIALTPLSFLVTVGMLTLLAFALTGMGFMLAWRMEPAQGFHAVMNLILMPMWMLSGALFPVAGAAGWLAWVMRLNPLTYGVTTVRGSLALSEAGAAAAIPGLAIALGITLAFGFLMFAASAALVRRRVSEGAP